MVEALRRLEGEGERSKGADIKIHESGLGKVAAELTLQKSGITLWWTKRRKKILEGL